MKATTIFLVSNFFASSAFAGGLRCTFNDDPSNKVVALYDGGTRGMILKLKPKHQTEVNFGVATSGGNNHGGMGLVAETNGDIGVLTAHPSALGASEYYGYFVHTRQDQEARSKKQEARISPVTCKSSE